MDRLLSLLNPKLFESDQNRGLVLCKHENLDSKLPKEHAKLLTKLRSRYLDDLTSEQTKRELKQFQDNGWVTLVLSDSQTYSENHSDLGLISSNVLETLIKCLELALAAYVPISVFAALRSFLVPDSKPKDRSSRFWGTSSYNCSHEKFTSFNTEATAHGASLMLFSSSVKIQAIESTYLIVKHQTGKISMEYTILKLEVLDPEALNAHLNSTSQKLQELFPSLVVLVTAFFWMLEMYGNV
jgi:hypothetical protein